MIKRIAIFCIYDKYGIVDESTLILLKQISEVSSRIIVVINGDINDSEINKLRNITMEIVVRKNEGYDAGAYADILVETIGKTELLEYDELILCNNTFFGLFESIGNVFDKANMYWDVDFWGLTELKRGVCDHLQSYWIVFKKTIFILLYDYIENSMYKKITDIYMAHVLFEQGLFCYLVDNNIRYGVMYNTDNKHIYDWPDLCLEKYNVPIFKKKYFSKEYYVYDVAVRTLQLIQRMATYDVNIIMDYAKRIYNIDISLDDIQGKFVIPDDSQRRKVAESTLTSKEIKKIINKHDGCYIYGTGILAADFYVCYRKYIKNFMGFIVSDNLYMPKSGKYYNQKVYLLDDISVEDDEIIFVAVAHKSWMQIEKKLESCCDFIDVVNIFDVN